MMTPIKIFTIGFTKQNAEEFFGKLTEVGIKRIIDVRLNNTSQLAGFAKRDDLEFFLKRIAGIDYVHMPELAPTQEILDAYKKEKGPWSAFEASFIELMKERGVARSVDPSVLDCGCLLCSEDKPKNCHRRLVAEYFKATWHSVEIEHLM